MWLNEIYVKLKSRQCWSVVSLICGVPGMLAFAFCFGRVCFVRTVCFLSSPRLFGDFFVFVLSFGSLSTCLATPA